MAFNQAGIEALSELLKPPKDDDSSSDVSWLKLVKRRKFEGEEQRVSAYLQRRNLKQICVHHDTAYLYQ